MVNIFNSLVATKGARGALTSLNTIVAPPKILKILKINIAFKYNVPLKFCLSHLKILSVYGPDF